jgi:hypothetical protein
MQDVTLPNALHQACQAAVMRVMQFRCTNITALTLGMNFPHSTLASTALCTFTKLQSLTLQSRLEWVGMEDSIAQLTALTSCTVGNSHHCNRPLALGKLTTLSALHHLDINCHQLNCLGDLAALASFTRLQSLDMGRVRFVHTRPGMQEVSSEPYE